ncbi:MAG: hypothetical protein GX790_06595 [Syntrophomonadaceae bacterium]|nr:hypothetical protein [Syntrophomonadaceae bacterium]
MATVKIDRKQKNIMRAQIEDILKLQKDINAKIDTYAAQTEPPEYQKFWQELKTINLETIQKVSRYMIAKCNR